MVCFSEAGFSDFSIELNRRIEEEDSVECNDDEYEDCCDFFAFDRLHGPFGCGVGNEGVHGSMLSGVWGAVFDETDDQ